MALQTLELFNCDVAQAEDYRDKIFDMLDSVLYIDGFDRLGEPAPDDSDVDDYDGECSIVVVALVVVVVNGSYSAAPYSSLDRECITKVKIKHHRST